MLWAFLYLKVGEFSDFAVIISSMSLVVCFLFANSGLIMTDIKLLLVRKRSYGEYFSSDVLFSVLKSELLSLEKRDKLVKLESIKLLTCSTRALLVSW